MFGLPSGSTSSASDAQPFVGPDPFCHRRLDPFFEILLLNPTFQHHLSPSSDQSPAFLDVVMFVL